jgi:hypothetical protein
MCHLAIDTGRGGVHETIHPCMDGERKERRGEDDVGWQRMKTDRRTDIIDIIFVFVFMFRFGFEYG